MIRGELELQLLDKSGNVKNSIKKHNTVTDLGKMACLTRGIAGLFDQCNQYGAGVQKGYESGDYTNYTKPANSAVKLLLTDLNATEFAGKSVKMIDDENIIGYGFEDVAASADPKQGIRQNVTDSNNNIIVGTPTRSAAKWAWTGIEGNLKTVVMQIPPMSILHKINDDNTAGTITDFVPEGFDGVPYGYIATKNASGIGRLINLDTLTLSDFTPSGNTLAINGKSTRSGFEFGNYIITFPHTCSVYTAVENYITVYNKSTQAKYTVDPSTTFSGYYCMGFIIKNNTLYAVTMMYNRSVTTAYFKVFSVVVSDVSLTVTEVTADDVLDSSWRVFYNVQNGYYYSNNFNFVPVKLDNDSEYKTYCIGNSVTKSYLVADLVTETPSTAAEAPALGTALTAGVYRNRLYTILRAVDSWLGAGMFITPAGQFGNIFSYFDLEETWTITAADTLQVTYTYTLEDAT